MKRILTVLLVVLMIPALSLAAPLELDGATKEELLAWRQQIDDKLMENGWFPFEEITTKSDVEHITRLQNRLTELNFYSKEVTGKFDKNTTTAFSAFMKANGLKAGKTVTIADQELIFSDAAVPAPTPSPAPTNTPAPTPIPDEAVLELTKVSLFTRYNNLKFRVEAQNNSKDCTIDAFNLTVRAYNRYDEQLAWYGRLEALEYGFTEQACKITSAKKYTMGSYYFDLFGWDTATRIEVAVSRYHTTDGKTVDIPKEKLVWMEGILK